ncbi:hypothetical protein [Kitasatospora sp. NPDC093806]|uniref:hypothetical protein n=1 Tax=Kitasatospora sp. NPDC093806 TaxID=3155075 RepID=UPI003416721F
MPEEKVRLVVAEQIVVADVEHLRKNLGPRGEARVMLDHLGSHAQVVSADRLIPTREAAQLPVLS